MTLTHPRRRTSSAMPKLPCLKCNKVRCDGSCPTPGRVSFGELDKWMAEQKAAIRRSERITAKDLAVTITRVPPPRPAAKKRKR